MAASSRKLLSLLSFLFVVLVVASFLKAPPLGADRELAKQQLTNKQYISFNYTNNSFTVKATVRCTEQVSWFASRHAGARVEGSGQRAAGTVFRPLLRSPQPLPASRGHRHSVRSVPPPHAPPRSLAPDSFLFSSFFLLLHSFVRTFVSSQPPHGLQLPASEAASSSSVPRLPRAVARPVAAPRREDVRRGEVERRELVQL